MVNIERLTQLAAYLLRKHGGFMEHSRLMRLLYFADRKSLKDGGGSMTGDEYYSYPNGSRLRTLSKLMARKADISMQAYWDARFSNDGMFLVTLSDRIPDGALSTFEREILDDLDCEYGYVPLDKVIEATEQICTEWQGLHGVPDFNNIDWDNPPVIKKIPIEKADILRAQGIDEETITCLLEELPEDSSGTGFWQEDDDE